MSHAAVFMDRDGVINEDRAYVHRVEDFAWIAGVKEALGILRGKGYLLVLVTNQAGIAYGYYALEDYLTLTGWMQQELARENLAFDGVYFCPHHPTKGQAPYLASCRCRKPGTGMLEEARRDLDISFADSYMVGDRMTDVETDRNAGCRQSFLVTTGKPLPDFQGATPDFVRRDLLAVATELPEAGLQHA